MPGFYKITEETTLEHILKRAGGFKLPLIHLAVI